MMENIHYCRVASRQQAKSDKLAIVESSGANRRPLDRARSSEPRGTRTIGQEARAHH